MNQRDRRFKKQIFCGSKSYIKLKEELVEVFRSGIECLGGMQQPSKSF